MAESTPLTKAKLLGGTTWIALAEATMLPTGFLTVLFLTRYLGPADYGLFALASTLVTWIEWSINSIFSRTTVKLIGDVADWRTVASVVLRAQLGCSLLAALVLALGAPAMAGGLREPALTPLLWLFALEIPLFNLTQAHQNILAGLGRFGQRAAATASRWIARLLLIVLLVQQGLSLSGAAIGCLGALLVSLVVCRWAVQPPLFYPQGIPAKRLMGYAAPLFFSALAMRLYGQGYLIALKALGGTARQAGLYAIAQNLSLLGGVLAPALAPVLLTKLGQLSRQEKLPRIRQLSRVAMRGVFLHLPLAGIVLGSAPELVDSLFGDGYGAAAAPFRLLLLAAIAGVMMTVNSTILLAADRPRWLLWLTAPLPLLALAGQWLWVPRWGETGAATATLVTALIGAIAGLIVVYLQCGIRPPLATAGRSTIACGLLWLAAATWPASGAALLLKLGGLGAVSPLLLVLLGEFSQADRALVRQVLADVRRKYTPNF